jgi:hypothetical protein
LQLNSLPALDPERRYRHVREWIADIDARRRADLAFEAAVGVARDQRLLIGGIKNLLSGVTTVAHHDPLYPYLRDGGYPVKVVAHYGWSHSLYLDGEKSVRDSHRRTPPDRPWIIHAAEGVDRAAAQEFERLDSLGCIGANTLLIHGVALDGAQRLRLARAGAGLIWCPSSNRRLFGAAAQVDELWHAGRVGLGTDSRLSGARDLLAELRGLAETVQLPEATLESLVTQDNARLLRLADRGALRTGACADLLVMPGDARLGAAARGDVRLVLIDGVARYGDAHYTQHFAPAAQWRELRVDDRPKCLRSGIAALLAAAGAREPGLDLPTAATRAA